MKRLAPDTAIDITPQFDIEAECAKYRDHLKIQLQLAKQASYKDVAIESLVQRALARKKPFDSGGKIGFRDAVLWETVLQLAEQSPDKIVLVTRNTNDFGKDGQLHVDLRGDLTSKGLSHVPIVVCAGLGQFVDEYVKPNLEKLDDIQQQINEEEFPGFDAIAFFEDAKLDIVDELQKHVRRIDIDRITHGSIYNFCRPNLGSTAKSIESFQVVDVWRINEEQIGVGIDYELPGIVDCSRECSDDPFERPYDEDYSDDVLFTLMMAVVVEEQSGEIVSWELTDVEVKATGDWGFPDNDD